MFCTPLAPSSGERCGKRTKNCWPPATALAWNWQRANTPGIIKYPFWRMTAQNQKAVYAYINLGQAFAPKQIEKQSIVLDGDVGYVLAQIS